MQKEFSLEEEYDRGTRPWEECKDEVSRIIHPLVPTPVFQSYWYFATERQNIYFKRLRGESAPWTNDPILQKYRFTNAYRAADRVSQYLIKQILYNEEWSPENLFFRCLLFKIFNKIDTWELLVSNFGEPTVANFNPNKYAKVLGFAQEVGERIYSAAYIMPSGGKGIPKHEFHLQLLNELNQRNYWKLIQSAESLKAVYDLLLVIKSFGPFLAFQYAIDLNYSTLINFDEADFVVAGPGAKSGICKCFSNPSNYSDEEIIMKVYASQQALLSSLQLDFHRTGTRDLQPIDCQNLFCETDKYARVWHPDIVGTSNRQKIKQSFSSNKEAAREFFPPKWGL